MLTLDIYHTNQCLSLELPLPTEVLAGELRAFHVEQTMNHITQDDFTLTPTNELGEHFMKPTCLHTIWQTVCAPRAF